MTAPIMDAKLLWDVDPERIDGAAHLDFILGRVMGEGSVDDLRSLRRRMGDSTLREHLTRTRGRRIDRRRLRYLETLLDLDDETVTSWISDPVRRVWDAR